MSDIYKKIADAKTPSDLLSALKVAGSRGKIAHARTICSICGRPYKDTGHNAQPINDGRCCETCNDNIVKPRRIENIKHGKGIYER